MCRVHKPYGYGAGISIENLDTLSSISLSNSLLSKIVTMLEEAGHKIEDAGAEWDITIEQETAEKLAALAMPMTKPIRNQSNKVKTHKPIDGEVDAFDLIFGSV